MAIESAMPAFGPVLSMKKNLRGITETRICSWQEIEI